MTKYIGYVIVGDSRPLRHWESEPYWLQFSSGCDLYPTYASARSAFKKQMRRYRNARNKRWISAGMYERWTETLAIIPVRKP